MTPQELKASILQYAIQGRLTEQNANDQSLSTLSSSIDPSTEVPYDIPASWKWFRLEDIATLYNGRAYKKPEMLVKGKYPLLRVGNLFTNDSWYYSDLELEPEKYCEYGDLLYAWSASFGPHIWHGEKVIYHYHIWKVELKVPDMRDYLYWALEAQTQALKKSGHGSTMIHITKANTEKMMIPLPPLAEQKRIVAKLEAILPLIDRYEAAWNKLEEFNKRFPGDMQKSILQLAIQGKLVEQRPEEGTGEELFQQIQAEKQALIKAGKIKKEKPLPEIADDEIPFDTPDSWKWYRIGELFNIVNGFTPLKSNPEFWTDGDIPWFTIEDVRRQGRFISSTEKFITRKALAKNTERIVPADTVLLCCTASVGEYAYTKIPLTTNQQFNAFVVKDYCKNAVHPLYVFEYAKTLKVSLIDRAGKTTFNFVSVGKLSNMLIPLPPLAEQKRIVAKLEEILPLCERLK